MSSSVGIEFPKEQERLRALLVEYKSIGPAGTFGALIIERALKNADQAMASGDVVAIVRAFAAMQEITG